MFLIDSIPAKLQGFFKPMKDHFYKAAYEHFWAFVLALSVSSRPRKIIHISQGRHRRKHRTGVSDFLRKSPWNEAEVLDTAAWQTLALMNPRAGETIYLVIDETKQAKRGKLMAAVGKLFDHVAKLFTRGHTALVACVVFRGVTLPLKIQLYAKKEFCQTDQAKKEGIKFATLTDMAARIIESFDVPAGLKVFVLFDSFYLCSAVVQACHKKGFTFISVAKSNRKFTFQGRLHRVGRYLPGLLRHGASAIRIPSPRGWKHYRVACRDGFLSRVGQVRLVASRRASDRTAVALVTNNRSLSPRQVLLHYEYRWHIEILFKQFKQYLGWGDYQIRSYRGIVRHLHLVAAAHLMLTHRALTSLGAQARKANVVLELPGVVQLQDQVRGLIWRGIKRKIIRGVKDEKLLRRLERRLGAIAA